jgi:hypothetical protein
MPSYIYYYCGHNNINLDSNSYAIITMHFAQEPEFLTFISKEFGFSIQYPSDWKKEEENMSKSSNVNIAVSFVKQKWKPGWK